MGVRVPAAGEAYDVAIIGAGVCGANSKMICIICPKDILSQFRSMG